MTTANQRKILGSKWKRLINQEIESVKKAKLSINPRVTPKGRQCPLLWEEEAKIIGNKGQIQGANMVTNPERNAKKNSIIMSHQHFIKIDKLQTQLYLT